MKTKNLMLFCYDFPHKKTQDFLIHLLINGYNIKYVVASPWKELNIPKPLSKIAPENIGLIHPKILCRAFKIPYIVSDHNNKKTFIYFKNHPVDLYIVAGARILSGSIIRAANNRILNIHPGLLPEIRGLDTLPWSIYKDIPLGITAHFISPKIDSGLLIFKEKLCLKRNDTIIDVSLRLLEKQPEALIHALKILQRTKMSDLEDLALSNNSYHTKMPHDLEKNLMNQFPIWLKKYSNI